jgi:HEPN domain-containing protein
MKPLDEIEYIMQNAVVFYDTGYDIMNNYLSNKGDEKQNSYLTVAATNIHFAVEMALKALSELTIKNFNPKRSGHNLHKLFTELNETRQKNIANSYNNKISSPNRNTLYGLTGSPKEEVDKAINEYDSDLISVLENHKKGFEHWRYNSYGINTTILFFDFQAFACLFQSIQMEIGLSILSLKAKPPKFELVD